MATTVNSDGSVTTTTLNEGLGQLSSLQKKTRSPTISRVETKVESAQEASQSVQYTLFASGLNNGGRNMQLKDKNYSTDIAMIFDVVDSHTYTRTVDKTSYSTEDKTKYSDHGVVEDGKFSFSARVTSSPTNLVQNNYLDKDTDPENPLLSRRPEKALQILEKILTDRQLVTLVTEDNILDNYIITSLEASRSNADGAGLVFNIELTEFRTFVLGKTVLGNNFVDPKKTNGAVKQKGAVASSASDKEFEVYERRTRFKSEVGKGIFQPAMDSMGIDSKSDQVVGTLKGNGDIVLKDGSIKKAGG